MKTMMKNENNPIFERTNIALVDVFNNVMWVEEAYLQSSDFRDITIKDMHTIAAIPLHGARTATELAGMVHLTPSAMTSAIDKLVRKGYVERERDETDRRMVYIKLTHRGKVVSRAHEAFHRSITHALFDTLDEVGAVQVEQVVLQLQDYLHQIKVRADD
ncbi:MarR family transcriptional regulator [Weissella soli]|jgi:DNA-binding MarR family transcriptional regulator|nr:MarR family transcriptional regulator [Weissella soli]MCT8394620.1 MarR family transcriptional regulator [Weissella soli]QEA35076.1 MarR family transcriptional regulator [Weissella soli]GJM48617.1 MarR family transcriptional regulator [Weissella soli]